MPPRKPAPIERGDHAADHAGREAGAVGDRVGDEAGQDRHHQGKAALGADREQGPGQRAFVRIVIHVDAAERKAQGDQQAAGDHERHHVGHAGHQVLVGTGAAGALLRLGRLDLVGVGHAGRRRWRPWPAAIAVRTTCGAVVDGGLGAGLVDALAGEAGHVDLGVGGDQHDLGAGDLGGGQRVLRTDRALGFDLDGVARWPWRPSPGLRRP